MPDKSYISSTEFQLVVRGQSELREDLVNLAKGHREDMKAISESQIDLNNKFSVYIERSQFADQQLQEIKHSISGDRGMLDRLTKLEVVQEGNRVRWAVMAAGVAAVTAIGGLFAWIIDKMIG